jgi:hypothetical protein
MPVMFSLAKRFIPCRHLLNFLIMKIARWLLPLLGERAGVRAGSPQPRCEALIKSYSIFSPSRGFARLERMRKFVFLIWLVLVLPAAGEDIRFNFSSFSTSQSLTNEFFSALAGGGRPGDWQIVMDEVPSAFTPLSSNAPAINHVPVLAQLDTDPTDERFPMLIYRKENFKDFTLTTRFKILDGVLEQMAGVVFRFQNESNFYVVRVSALGRNLRFYKVVNGVRGNLIGPPLDISTGTWHSLTIHCEGNSITCLLDDKLVMPSLQDPTFDSGKIGFWTKSDSLTHFGDTTISYTPVVPMAQLVVQNVSEQQPRLLGLRIYTLDKAGTPRVIASKVSTEVGLAGTDAEKGAITNGATFFGRGRGTVAVTLPLEDRNGDPVAAVRIQFKSFLGETRDNALLRAHMIVSLIQSQILTSQDLAQ